MIEIGKNSQEYEHEVQRPTDPIPHTSQEDGMILFRNLPQDLPIFICTGYTDMRKSIAGLGKILEEDYETDPRSRCLTLFCGRQPNRFKAFLYDGDGYCLMTKYLSSGRLTWPRNGGRTDGEMWWISQQQFIGLMEGKAVREGDIDGDEDVPEPSINTEKLTLFNHIMKNNLLPGGIFLRTGFTDLRKSVKGLSSIIDEYEVGPQSGTSCCVFMGRRMNRLKALFYDGNGFMLISKALDSGSYIWPKGEGELWKIAYSQAYDFLTGKAIDQDRVLRVIRR